MPGRTEKAPLRQPLWAGVAAEMLLDRIAQGVLIVSWDGKVTYANRTLAAMACLQHSSLPGSPLVELVGEVERERLGIALGAGRESLTHQRFALQRPDASELPVLMTFAPLAHGQASCLVTDLRDRKRREESADRLSSFLGTLAYELRGILSPMRKSLRMLEQQHGLDEDGWREVETLQRQAERMLFLVEDLRKING
jgi:nitrogen-specific signal transduction histidine kinase